LESLLALPKDLSLPLPDVSSSLKQLTEGGGGVALPTAADLDLSAAAAKLQQALPKDLASLPDAASALMIKLPEGMKLPEGLGKLPEGRILPAEVRDALAQVLPSLGVEALPDDDAPLRLGALRGGSHLSWERYV